MTHFFFTSGEHSARERRLAFMDGPGMKEVKPTPATPEATNKPAEKLDKKTEAPLQTPDTKSVDTKAREVKGKAESKIAGIKGKLGVESKNGGTEVRGSLRIRVNIPSGEQFKNKLNSTWEKFSGKKTKTPDAKSGEKTSAAASAGAKVEGSIGVGGRVGAEKAPTAASAGAKVEGSIGVGGRVGAEKAPAVEKKAEQMTPEKRAELSGKHAALLNEIQQGGMSAETQDLMNQFNALPDADKKNLADMRGIDANQDETLSGNGGKKFDLSFDGKNFGLKEQQPEAKADAKPAGEKPTDATKPDSGEQKPEAKTDKPAEQMTPEKRTELSGKHAALLNEIQQGGLSAETQDLVNQLNALPDADKKNLADMRGIDANQDENISGNGSKYNLSFDGKNFGLKEQQPEAKADAKPADATKPDNAEKKPEAKADKPAEKKNEKPAEAKGEKNEEKQEKKEDTKENKELTPEQARAKAVELTREMVKNNLNLKLTLEGLIPELEGRASYDQMEDTARNAMVGADVDIVLGLKEAGMSPREIKAAKKTITFSPRGTLDFINEVLGTPAEGVDKGKEAAKEKGPEDQLKDAIDKLVTEFPQLKEIGEALKKLIDQMKDSAKTETKTDSSGKDSLKIKNASPDKVKSDIAEREKKIKDNEGDIADIDGDLKKADESSKTLDGQRKEVDQNLKNLRADPNSSPNDIRRMVTQLNRVDKQIAANKEEIKDLTAQRKELVDANTNLQKEIDGLKNKEKSGEKGAETVDHVQIAKDIIKQLPEKEFGKVSVEGQDVLLGEPAGRIHKILGMKPGDRLTVDQFLRAPIITVEEGLKLKQSMQDTPKTETPKPAATEKSAEKPAEPKAEKSAEVSKEQVEAAKVELKDLQGRIKDVINREESLIKNVTEAKNEAGYLGYALDTVTGSNSFNPLIEKAQNKINVMKNSASPALEAAEAALKTNPPNMAEAQRNMNIVKGSIAIVNKVEKKV